MKIVSTAPMPAGFVQGLLAPHVGDDLELDVIALEKRSRDELLELAPGADILVGDYTFEIPIDDEVIAALRHCRLIQQPSAGYQHIDVAAAATRGIPVANTGGANDRAVAEHTVMVGLALLKSLFWADRETRTGTWPQMAVSQQGCVELGDRTWGIVGFGRIGREVARRLRGFGCRILYYDVAAAPSEVEGELGAERRELSDIYRESDVISLHVPLTDETRNMIDEAAIKEMGSSTYLVNVARGEVVNEADLVAALESKRLKGAAIDVFSEEPPDAAHPLFALDNVIVTPHVAGVTDEARRRIMQRMVENLARVVRGEPPVDVVNGVSV